MNIISSKGNNTAGLWLVVEAEENEVIVEGKFDHFMLGKIRLDGTRIEKHGDQYKIFYEDVILDSHPNVFDSNAMFLAYALSVHFKDVAGAVNGVLPCEFPDVMLAQMREELKERGLTIEEVHEYNGMLVFGIYGENEEHVSSFSAPTASAYLDFIISGKPRAKNFYYYKEKQFGPHGNEAVEKYVEKLNEKLRAAATSVGLDQAYAYFDKDNFHIIAGLNTGRAAHHEMPGCMLNFFVDNNIDLPFEFKVDGNIFTMETQLGKAVPSHILATLDNLNNWNMLKLIGLVR